MMKIKETGPVALGDRWSGSVSKTRVRVTSRENGECDIIMLLEVSSSLPPHTSSYGLTRVVRPSRFFIGDYWGLLTRVFNLLHSLCNNEIWPRQRKPPKRKKPRKKTVVPVAPANKLSDYFRESNGKNHTRQLWFFVCLLRIDGWERTSTIE